MVSGGASQTNKIIKEKTPCALFDKMIVPCWSPVSFEHVQKSCIMENDQLFYFSLENIENLPKKAFGG